MLNWLRIFNGNSRSDAQNLLPSSKDESPPLIQWKELSFFNSNLSDNQKDVVAATLQAKCRPNFHVVVRDGGSRDVDPLLESALQVIKNAPSMKTLIICGSNEAAESIIDHFLNPNIINWRTVDGQILRGDEPCNKVPIRRLVSDQHMRDAKSRMVSNKLTSNFQDLRQEFHKIKIVVTVYEDSILAKLKSCSMLFNFVFLHDADPMSESEILLAKKLTKSPDGVCVLYGSFRISNKGFSQLLSSELYQSEYILNRAFTSILWNEQSQYEVSKSRENAGEIPETQVSTVQDQGYFSSDHSQSGEVNNLVSSQSNVTERQTDVTAPLNVDNYGEKFCDLLSKEEYEVKKSHSALTAYGINFLKEPGRWCKKYVSPEATITFVEVDVLAFTLPALWESSKRMLTLETQLVFTSKLSKYYGQVACINDKKVWVDFEDHQGPNRKTTRELFEDPKFMKSSFRVDVLPNLVSIKRCDNAARTVKTHRALFPIQKIANRGPVVAIDRDKFNFVSQNLDATQKTAVMGVVRGECFPKPYLIFGPPGTGKTITLIESILQVYLGQPRSKILVCGNSNECTDMLASLLLQSGKLKKARGNNHDIVRLKSKLRIKLEREQSENLKPITRLPTYKFEARIVVTTCNSAAYLRKKCLFDYVFIDESGHAIEPDILIPMECKKDSGMLVLAGDPFQLAPVVKSDYAATQGLAISLLERLFKQDVYKPEEAKGGLLRYNNTCITQLTTCRRSDKRIMAPSNALFYNQRVVCTNQTPPGLLKMLNFSSPLVFQEQKLGCEEREGSSWYNIDEAIACRNLVHKIVVKSNFKSNQIGVIAFYRSQVEQMERIFASDALLKDCKIATVDEFQGQERDIILISTVRSSRTTWTGAKFMFDARRFNVAVSRARYLVVTFGDRKLLCHNPNWRVYLKKACIKKPQP